MPATRHRFTKCGHKGRGTTCHRCDQADKLEKLLPKSIASEEFKQGYELVKRLRAP